MGILDKEFDVVTGFHVLADTPSGGGSTTIASAAVAKDAVTVQVTAATNFAIGDDIRIGSGETAELCRISNLVSTTITLAKPTIFAHAIGEPVVELSAIDLGNAEADGVKFSVTVDSEDAFDVISRLPYNSRLTYGRATLSWRYLTVSTDILALALGLPRSAVIGSGTAAAQTGTAGPRLFTTDGVLMGGLTNTFAVVQGKLVDGTWARVNFNGLSYNPTGLSVTLSRTGQPYVPVSAMTMSLAIDTTQSQFVPANVIATYATTNADMFSEIVDVNELTDSGTANTTSGSTAAGAYAIVLSSATGFAAGDWVRIGEEYHLVHGVATNTLNLRTQVQKAYATSTAVTKQTVTNVGGIDGGFTLSTSGSAEPRQSETSRMEMGYKLSNIGAQIAFNAKNVTPETFVRAFGLSTTALPNSVAANVLPVNNDTLAKAVTKTFLFRGLTQGGKNLTICAWTGACQVNATDVTMSQASNLLVPVAYKPKALQVFVNA